MSAITDQIIELKTGAKNQRNRGLRGYQRAITMLQDGITLARRDFDNAVNSAQRAQMAGELSDCFGLLGGVERRWADETTGEERTQHLQAAARAYDAGERFESDPEFGLVNSYNRVNRLLVRFLLDDTSSTDAAPPAADAGLPPVDLHAELAAAADAIRVQLAGPRRGDYWALADLALIDTLIGRAPPEVAYADLLAASPPDFVLTSALGGLKALAELPEASAVRDAVVLLDSRLQRLRD